MPRRRTLCSAALAALALSACGGYELRNLAKSDINLVTDEFIDETRRLVRELMVKLYARNPRQLERGRRHTVEARLQQLRDTPGPLVFDELGRRQEIAALELVFDPDFGGDRVFALVIGLGGMLRRAYGYDTQSYMFDSQNPDSLHTSARNIEILLWRLRNNRQTNGDPFLVTSEYRGVTDNLSFERLFGKLIALQDMMARIAGDAGDRRVTKVVHTATSVFIPLPL
ncbi:MAG: hypothetical protein V2I82_05845 [Halieaceae bacterium]|jgi:hypothetical protein|nr:hypothetical protein [Halieaceae bacterium]